MCKIVSHMLKSCNNGGFMMVLGWNLFIYDICFTNLPNSFLRFPLILMNM